MKYKLFCFDLDGVLYSSEPIIGQAYIDAIQSFNQLQNKNFHIPSTEEILHEVGKPVKEIFANLFPHASQAETNHISDNVLTELIKLISAKKGDLLPNAHKILKLIKTNNGINAITSNGRKGYVQAVLNSFEMASYFSENHFISEPDIQTKGGLIVYYQNLFNISKEETLMIGDRETDYEAAKFAQVDFVAVLSGHGNDFESLEPTYKVHNLNEISEFVHDKIVN